MGTIDTQSLVNLIDGLIAKDNNQTAERIQSNIVLLNNLKEKLPDEYESFKDRINTGLSILEKDLKAREKIGG